MDDANYNSLLSELEAAGLSGLAELRKLYLKRSKDLHPDTTGLPDAFFQQLQREYEEARIHILTEPESPPRKEQTQPAAPQRDFPVFSDRIFQSVISFPARERLYYGLYRYTLAGLHGARARMRNNLQQRNREIISFIFHAAHEYDPAFIPVFTNYHRTMFYDFDTWRQGKLILDRLKRNFHTGIQNFFDYQRRGLIQSKRVSQSFLNDTIDDAKRITFAPGSLQTAALAEWLLGESEKESIRGLDWDNQFGRVQNK